MLVITLITISIFETSIAVLSSNSVFVNPKSSPRQSVYSVVLQGAPVGLHVLEVRDTSVVVLWEPPAFNGRTPVNGYYLDLKEASAGEEGLKAAHEKANKSKYMKVRKMERSFFCLSVAEVSHISLDLRNASEIPTKLFS